ncbi:MAG: response regulator [Verrucomicrobiota bacterium]
MADSKKILVLEDERSSALLITKFLEKRGYEVFPSGEARFAIDLALREKPDLMIADILLPDMHGSEAVKQLKSSPITENMEVLFLTSLLGKKGATDAETVLKVDGKEYPAIGKPFKPDVLSAVVDRLIGGAN